MIQCPPMKYLTVAPVKSSAASECSWAEQSPSRAIAQASRAIAMRHRSRIGHGPTYSHSMIVDLLGDSLLHVRIAMCARRVRATAASDAWKAQRSPIAVSACAVSAGSGQPEGEHLAARRPEQAKGQAALACNLGGTTSGMPVPMAGGLALCRAACYSDSGATNQLASRHSVSAGLFLRKEPAPRARSGESFSPSRSSIGTSR